MGLVLGGIKKGNNKNYLPIYIYQLLYFFQGENF